MLLAHIDGKYDVFITADKNLRHQQSLSRRSFAVIELPTNRLPLLQPLFPRIIDALNGIKPTAYIKIKF